MAEVNRINIATGTFKAVVLANTATRVSLSEAPFTYEYDEAGDGSVVYTFTSPDLTPVDGAAIILANDAYLVSAADYAAMSEAVG